MRFSSEPDAAFLGLYRYRGQDLPPIARTLMMSAPWQAFGTILPGRPHGGLRADLRGR